jgi:glycosyltransferase involved in cell wall biosynthesis
MRLSVIVPAYNEEATVEALLRRVLDNVGLRGEVVVVDDASRDATAWITERMAGEDARVRLVRHERNQGKGAAVRTGLAAATGDVALIQDADLEYDPADYPALVAPIEQGEADAIFGSRYLRGRPGQERRYYLANRFMTWWFNLLYRTRLTDVLTCYKAFLLKRVDLAALGAPGFEIEIELASHLVRRGLRVQEAPISYAPRANEAGKKIRWWHAVLIAWAVVKYRWRKV